MGVTELPKTISKKRYRWGVVGTPLEHCVPPPDATIPEDLIAEILAAISLKVDKKRENQGKGPTPDNLSGCVTLINCDTTLVNCNNQLSVI